MTNIWNAIKTALGINKAVTVAVEYTARERAAYARAWRVAAQGYAISTRDSRPLRFASLSDLMSAHD